MNPTQKTTRSAASTAPAQLGRYAIDPARSTVGFRTRHIFGLLPVRGRFAVLTGTVDVAEPRTESSVRAEIETASFDTGNPARDRTVRSARFLNAERHPVITFVSGGIDGLDGTAVVGTAVVGTLTAHGVSGPVRLTVENVASTPDGFTVRATTRIDRTGFGVTASRGMAGRYLDVTLEIACVRG